MSLSGPERPPEAPLAELDQQVGGHSARYELFVDRVRSTRTDLLGSRSVSLPLDTLSPHVVIRQRGRAIAIALGAVLGGIVMFTPGGSWPLAATALLVGLGAWVASRRQYIVFPGQICDLELFRDRPDASTARHFVAQVVRRIESVQVEFRALERRREGEASFDRVGELLAFRDLYAEGIIDRTDFRLATELLARKGSRRIGFR